MKSLKYTFFLALAAFALYACSPAKGEFAGTEYMPDMGHPISYEPNTLDGYYNNTWEEGSVMSRRNLTLHDLPVIGSVPRGYAGVSYAGAAAFDSIIAILRGKNTLNAIAVPVNGHVPYYFKDSEEERVRASNEYTVNPFPITAAGLEHGKELYTIFCGICHGDKGNGGGYLVAEENLNAKYPAAPANFLLDTFYVSSNGRFYHAIMYGKNVMGGYSDKLSYEERWQVIHYIRSLQAVEKKLQYTATANTLNPSFGTPSGQIKGLAIAPAPAAITGATSGGGGGGVPSKGNKK
jgi:mono/diheme cytochrome c family protein